MAAGRRTRNPDAEDDSIRRRVEAEIREMRAQADDLLDAEALDPVRDAWEDEIEDLVYEARRELRGKGRQKMGPVLAGSMLLLLGRRATGLANRIGGALASSSTTTLRESVRGLGRFLYRADGKPTPLDDPTVAERIVQRYQVQAAAEREAAAVQTTRNLVQRIYTQVQQSAAQEFDAHDALEGLEITAERQWYQVECLVQTETSRAYNRALSDGIAEAAIEIPDLCARWTEYVDDFTRRPLDNRVGADSLVLHGQIARPGGIFTMPLDAIVKGGMQGQSWRHPPNRPRDRAVLNPWRREWGIPSYLYQNGARIEIG